jgi:hypothetical protein
MYISPEIKEKISAASELHFDSFIQSIVDLKRDGNAGLKGECPACMNPKMTLKYAKSKKIAKCFHCEVAASNAINFLVKFKGYDYQAALIEIAGRYDISLEEKKTSPKKDKNSSLTFRNSQLMSSGIPDKAQKWMDRISSTTEIESNRYEKGSIDQYNKINYEADDMLLYFVGLDNKPIMYKTERGKEQQLIRVRYQFPEQHRNKEGEPTKYRSPSGSGSHLWLPQTTIANFTKKIQFDTLIVVEGEKKADKLAIHGHLSIGIMGIHNFATANEMPHQFLAILKDNQVKNVIFLLDTDWKDITLKSNKPVDQRPKSFFAAVRKFRDYFYGFAPDIQLRIFFGHHQSTKSKGIDDFMVSELKGKEDQFTEDISKAIIDREHHTDRVQLYDITSMSDYKLKEYWSIQSSAAFINAYKDQLTKLGEFTLEGIKRRVNEDGEIELAQKLLPHEQYWIEENYGKNGDNTRFFYDYLQVLNFLKNRGYGLYHVSKDLFRFIHIENNIVSEVTPHNIQHFVKNFTNELDDNTTRNEVLRMLLRGMSQYLGQDKLSQMDYLPVNLYKPDKEAQYLFFNSKYVRITADSIEMLPINNLPYQVWEDHIIDFEPKIIDNMIRIERKDDYWWTPETPGSAWEQCDMARFLYNTSFPFWRKYQKLIKMPDGSKKWVNKSTNEIERKEDAIKEKEEALKEYKETMDHLAAKMIAIGYMLYEYRDSANQRAIVGMDMEETEVGTSQGGTGKSIFSTMFEKLVPAFVVDGKSARISEDPHLYDGVDERTRIIIFDDCRVNFDFEFLFSQISRGVTVNPKGLKKFTVPSPKFILNTNHAFNGEGNSFARRQYMIAFSDYYNEYRTPYDDFGHLLFQDWDHAQWNLFYNLIFVSIQLYLKYGLKYGIPVKNVEKRKLRQKMGENFLEWALNIWGESSSWINNHVEKKYAYDDFMMDFPSEKKYTDIRKFKKKVRYFAEYTGLYFNPDKGGESIKSGNLEYLCIANKAYNPNQAEKISRNEYAKQF